jgi:chromosome condensin MukBEF ATPase and DNA-binding subunit MukB
MFSDFQETDGDAEVFKYVVWGSTDECMTYLLRRAEENRDAIGRSLLSRRALWEELYRRLMGHLPVPADRID